MVRQSSIRFLLLAMSFTAITHLYGQHLANAMLPPYKFAITHLDSHIETIHISVIHQYNQKYLQFDCALSRQFFIGNHFFLLDHTIVNSSSVALDFVLQPIVIFLTLTLSWPARLFREYIFRISLGGPLIFAWMLLDFPMQSIYLLWNNVEKELGTSGNAQGLLLFWNDFLNGGGLMAISIGISIVTISITSSVLNPKFNRI